LGKGSKSMIKAPTLTLTSINEEDYWLSRHPSQLEYLKSNIGHPIALYSLTYIRGELYRITPEFDNDEDPFLVYVRDITGTIDFSGEYQIKIGEEK
jgi:hypothetical protein